MRYNLLAAHADGSLGVSTQRFSNIGQSRIENSGTLRGQLAARLPLRAHPGNKRVEIQ